MAKITKKKSKKKKKWFQIQAPKTFNEQLIGEGYAFELKDLIGKNLTINLMTLTNNPKKQGNRVFFEIVGQTADKAITKVTGLEITPSTIKRLVRRNRDRIDNSYILKTKDDINIQIKPLIITRNITQGLMKRKLRKNLEISLKKKIKTLTFEEVINFTLQKKLQKELYFNLKKLVPIVILDIRYVKQTAKLLKKQIDNEEEILEEAEDEDIEEEDTENTEDKVKTVEDANEEDFDDDEEDEDSEEDDDDEEIEETEDEDSEEDDDDEEVEETEDEDSEEDDDDEEVEETEDEDSEEDDDDEEVEETDKDIKTIDDKKKE
jgi:ribosomal protein S3AE